MTDRSPDQVVSKTLRRALEGGSCEVCHCTEQRACPPDGCAWDGAYLLLGRLVCTRCTKTSAILTRFVTR